MRAPVLAVVASFAVACEPPPEVGGVGEPTIDIAYPPRDVGAIATDCAGDLDLLVVVDLDDIELQSPYVEGVEPVDGQGHWHATLGGLEGYTPSFTHSTRVLVEDAQLGITRLTVSLQDNLHDDIVSPGAESSIEFEIAAPDPLDCP